MWIDIIQAYADALQVATTQRPVPAPARKFGRSSREDAEVPLATTSSPAVWRRIAGWLVRRIHQADTSQGGKVGSGAELTVAQTGLKGCGS
jgi:hypothetical protein